MSLLQSQGHHQAHLYPLCAIAREADLVRRRINHHTQTHAIVTMSAFAAVQNGKKSIKMFNKLMESFSDGKAG